MRCCKCNRDILEGSEFCSYCGTAQDNKLFCRKCGKEIPKDSEFCQHCGTPVSTITTPINTQVSKQSIKKWPIVIIAAIVLLIVAVIIFCVVVKPFTTVPETIDTNANGDSLQTLKNQSEYIDIAEYKEIYYKSDAKNRNYRVSGIIIDDQWSKEHGIRIATENRFPFDNTSEEEYKQSEEYKKKYPNSGLHFSPFFYSSVDKTPTVYCTLDVNGVINQAPTKGDYVDVYFLSTGDVTINAYAIDV